MPKFLDGDGVLVSITGNAGTMCHAHEEYWWPCLRFGVEVHSGPATAPAPDAGGEWHRIDERVVDGVANAIATAADTSIAERIKTEHNAAPKLVAALKRMRAKFRACAIRVGSDPEFVDAGLADIDALIAAADQPALSTLKSE